MGKLIFPSGGTTPEVQRTLRGGPCGTLRCGTLRCGGTNPRMVRPRGYRFQRPPAERSEVSPPSEARPSRRAKRGSTERREAAPRLRRAKRGRAKVIGRSPLQQAKLGNFRARNQFRGTKLVISAPETNSGTITEFRGTIPGYECVWYACVKK